MANTQFFADPAVVETQYVCEVLFDEHNMYWKPDRMMNEYYLKTSFAYFNDCLRVWDMFLNDILKKLDMQRTKKGQIYGYLKGSKIDVRIVYDKELDAFRIIFLNMQNVYNALPD